MLRRGAPTTTLLVLLVVVASVLLLVAAASVESSFATTAGNYAGYQLLQVKFTKSEHVNQLQSILEDREVDVWSNDGLLVPYGINDLFLSPHDAQKVITELCKPQDLSCRVKCSDMESALEEHRMQISLLQQSQDDFYANYHTLEDNWAYTRSLVEKFPGRAQIVEIGRSWENRTMLAVKVSSGNGASRSKNATFIEGTIHAREWIATPVVQYALMMLLTQYGQNARVTRFLDAMDIYILPIANPDGFHHSWNGDRLWRKNRRNNGKNVAMGVDLNRNFPEGYGIGASATPSSQTYKGPGPLSEPEAQALDKFFKSHPEIIAGLDFHSYSQLLLRAYGYKSDTAPDEKRQKTLGARMQAAIQQVDKVLYDNIKGVDLYPAGGAFDDFMYEIHGMPTVYTVELRDKGKYGFLLPPQQIKPSVEEIWNGLLEFFDGVVAHMQGRE